MDDVLEAGDVCMRDAIGTFMKLDTIEFIIKDTIYDAHLAVQFNIATDFDTNIRSKWTNSVYLHEENNTPHQKIFKVIK